MAGLILDSWTYIENDDIGVVQTLKQFLDGDCFKRVALRCKYCGVFAIDITLSWASSSTVRSLWASRSSSSSRRGLANALPMRANCSYKLVFESSMVS